MWKSIHLSNAQYADLLVTLNNLDTAKQNQSAINPLSSFSLILRKETEQGNQIVFSPNTFEYFLNIHQELNEVEVQDMPEPKDVGTLNGFGYLFGSHNYYRALRVKD